MAASKRISVLQFVALGCVGLSVAAPSVMAADFPAKPITIIAASGPGGAVDLLSRIVGRYMEQAWGQTVVILNKAGGAGGIGATQAKSAAPDGYTLVTSNHGTWSNAWQQMEKPTFTVDDFTYINSMMGGGCAWVTRADGPYKTLKDMIGAAKSGKQVSFGAFSPENKLYVDYLAKREGIQIRSITFKSVPEVLQAVLGGHVDFGFSGGSHAQYVKKGMMRVLAATDVKRAPDSPDTPTLKEMGYGVSNCASFIIAGPKGLPKDITQKIADAVAKAMQTDEAKKFLDSRETTALLLGPDELSKLVHEDAAAYASVVNSLK